MRHAATANPRFSALARANPLVRMVGRDEPAWQVAAAAAARFDARIVRIDAPLAVAPDAAGDYAQIDANLAVVDGQPPGMPAAGVGYSGLAPAQRGALLQWLVAPTEPAPLAFQQLYLANLEVRLLEPPPMAHLALAELERLAETAAWDKRLVTPRLLLAFWLLQDGGGLARWLAGAAHLDGDTLDIALGLLARLGHPLTSAMLPAVLAAWQLPVPAITNAVLELRLNSLAATLGDDPLHHALGPALAAPDFAAWRCLHRDLRLALPQGRVRASLEPRLADMLTQVTLAPETAPVTPATAPTAAASPAAGGKEPFDKAHLIIEFRESRSEYFAWALRHARKQAGFQQLMDEDRHIVYRAPFRRNETRKFFDLWNCVQGWNNSHVYCQGRELEKWQVYEGSSHLR